MLGSGELHDHPSVSLICIMHVSCLLVYSSYTFVILADECNILDSAFLHPVIAAADHSSSAIFLMNGENNRIVKPKSVTLYLRNYALPAFAVIFRSPLTDHASEIILSFHDPVHAYRMNPLLVCIMTYDNTVSDLEYRRFINLHIQSAYRDTIFRYSSCRHLVQNSFSVRLSQQNQSPLFSTCSYNPGLLHTLATQNNSILIYMDTSGNIICSGLQEYRSRLRHPVYGVLNKRCRIRSVFRWRQLLHDLDFWDFYISPSVAYAAEIRHRVAVTERNIHRRCHGQCHQHETKYTQHGYLLL